MQSTTSSISRRSVLKALSATGFAFGVAPWRVPNAQAATGANVLVAKEGTAQLVGEAASATRIWGYNGKAPGPILRVTQGETLNVKLVNNLHQPTTLHWHGIRIANAMDGVPELTQDVVEPKASFDYRFECPDAGTFWYHPHKYSSEQVARGLHGALIVDERQPPTVDQDQVLVLDDWRLMRDGQIHNASFGAIGERAHGGRFGNTFTLNGQDNHKISVVAGQRVRLRLCNVANASSFAVRFADHVVRIIAIDGQPVKPFTTDDGVVLLSPGQRADVMIDMTNAPGTKSKIELLGFEQEVSVGRLVYVPDQKVRTGVLDAPIVLPDNPLAKQLDLANAIDVTLNMDGGAMGGMRGAKVDGNFVDMRRLVQQYGYVWAFNGTAGMPKRPLVQVKQGQTVRLRMVNQTGWPHAMHIHGHHFKQLEGNAGDGYGPVWRDTIVVRRGQELTVGFVADNPGKWMLHCHMLEHQEGGMATWFEVEV